MKIKNSKSTGKNNANQRAHSSVVLDGPERAPSRAMLYAVGFKKEDFKKPITPRKTARQKIFTLPLDINS